MRGRPKGTTLERKDIYAEEFKKLIEYVKTSNQKTIAKANAIKAFYLLYYFGFRAGELAHLKNYHIQRMAVEHVISLGNDTKTKTPRDAYVAPEHVDILKEVFKEELEEDEKFALLSPIRNRMTAYASSSLVAMLNRVLKKALGKQYSTHSFRAGYITTLHRANISIKTIAKVVGHKKEMTTMRYITISEEEKRTAVKQVGRVA
ncbi:MAG: site-specific integrase [Epsilonproteobacteria bacterium]|nr:site-specific integrase [Campylobacterota bacterium]